MKQSSLSTSSIRTPRPSSCLRRLQFRRLLRTSEGAEESGRLQARLLLFAAGTES